MTDNPYIEARMDMDTLVFRGEIHAAPIVDTNAPPQELTFEILRMFEQDFNQAEQVEDAIARIADRSLQAKVRRWQGLKKCIKTVKDRINQEADQLYVLGVDQR